MNLKTLSFVLFIFASIALHGQAPSQYQLADSLFNVSEYEAALENYYAFTQQAQSKENSHIWEVAQLRIGQSLNHLQYLDSAYVFLKDVSITNPDIYFQQQHLLGKIIQNTSLNHPQILDHFRKASSVIEQTTSIKENDIISFYAGFAGVFLDIRLSDSSRHYLNMALDLPSSQSVTHKSDLYGILGRSYFFEDPPAYDLATKYLDHSKKLLEGQDSLSLHEKYVLSAVYDSYGYMNQNLGYIDSSFYYTKTQLRLLETIKNIDPVVLARSYSNASLEYFQRGYLKEAESYADKSIQIYESNVGRRHRSLGHAYQRKALVLSKKPSSLNASLQFNLEALAIYENTYGAEHPAIINAKHEVGNSYFRLSQFEKALSYHQEGFDISVKHNDPRDIVESLENMGLTLVALERYEEAENYLFQGLSMVQQYMGPTSTFSASYAIGLANLAIKKEDLSLANKYTETAEKIYFANYGRTHPILAHLYFDLAELYDQLHQQDKSIELIQKAEQANSAQGSQQKPLQGIDEELSIHINELKASLYQRKYQATKNISWLETARDIYFTNALRLEKAINQSADSNDQKNYSNLHKKTFDGILTCLDLLYQEGVLDSKEVGLAMYNASKQSKALLMRIKQAQALSQESTLSSQTDIPLRKLVTDINYYKGLYYNTPVQNKKVREYYRTSIFQLRRDYSSLVSERQKTTLSRVSFDELLTTLESYGTLVEYALNKEHVFVFVINSGELEWLKIDLPDNHKLMIDELQQSLEDDNPKLFSKTSHELYKLLFSPITDYLNSKQLIIIPDGILWDINFDLLLASTPEETTSFKGLDFLLKYYAISYSFSVDYMIQKKSHDHTNGIIGFSYDQPSEEVPDLQKMRDETGNLPGTAQEITSLSALLQGNYYFGNEATEANFKKQAESGRILHLALHGVADSLNDERSKLYFTQSKQDTLEDGQLHAFELYTMQLRAELAVLTACDSGDGHLSSGEGVMSLGRAFLYAGANSVLLSNWKVSDALAPKIVLSFYNYLLEGDNKSEALRKAKLDFLEEANNLSANPYYWGGFSIVGDPKPVDLSQSNNNWYLYLIFGILLVAVAASRKKARNRD